MKMNSTLTWAGKDYDVEWSYIPEEPSTYTHPGEKEVIDILSVIGEGPQPSIAILTGLARKQMEEWADDKAVDAYV